jgi:hypothetical protein
MTEQLLEVVTIESVLAALVYRSAMVAYLFGQ